MRLRPASQITTFIWRFVVALLLLAAGQSQASDIPTIEFKRTPLFPERQGAAFVEFAGKYWMLGGFRHNFAYYGDPDRLFQITTPDVWSSEDGTHWEQVTDQVPWQLGGYHSAVAYNGRMYLFDGDSYGKFTVWSSADGVTWEEGTIPWPSYRGPQVIVHDNKIWAFIIHSDSGLLRAWSTTDAQTWLLEATNGQPLTNNYSYSGYANISTLHGELWVVVGTSVWSSTNGTDWIERTTSAPAGYLVRKPYKEKLWIFAQDLNRSIYSSSNGIDWTFVTSNRFAERGTLPFVADNRMILAGGICNFNTGWFSNRVLTSADGITWKTEGIHRFRWISQPVTIVFKDRLWVFSDYLYEEGRAWSSSDGTSWSSETFPIVDPLRYHAVDAVVFKDQLLVYLSLGGVMSSPDGKNWTHSSTGALQNFFLRFFVLGDRVLGVSKVSSFTIHSTDGINWSDAVLAPWTSRTDPLMTMHNNELFIIGGKDENQQMLTDVWKTENGTDWEQVTSDFGFTPLDKRLLFSAAGRLWAISGSEYSNYPLRNYSHEVWSSANGIDWQISPNIDGLRNMVYNCPPVTYNRKVYIIGSTNEFDISNEVLVADLPPILEGIELIDLDQENNPLAGYTNDSTVAVVAEGETAGTMLELSTSEDFAEFNSFPASTIAEYNMGSGDGLRTVYARLRNSSGAGNVTSATITLDTIPPVTIATGPGTKVEGNIAGSYSTADDSPSSTTLQFRHNYSDWVAVGSLAGGTIDYSPDAGGIYEFIASAVDAAGNQEAKSEADWRTIYNSTANGALALPVIALGPMTLIFPMEEGDPPAAVELHFNDVLTTGSAIVSRRDTLVSSPPRLDRAQLIDESIKVSTDFEFSGANIVWHYQNRNNLEAAEIEHAFRFEDEIMMERFDVVATQTEITITNVGGFSEWYAGDDSVHVHGWLFME